MRKALLAAAATLSSVGFVFAGFPSVDHASATMFSCASNRSNWVSTPYARATNGWSYCSSAQNVWDSQQVRVYCDSPTGTRYIDYGPWVGVQEFSNKGCFSVIQAQTHLS